MKKNRFISMLMIVMFLFGILPCNLFATGAAYPEPVVYPGPVAHWTFDEITGTTLADTSGSGLNGTLVNGPALTEGFLGEGMALRFNGSSQYADLGNPQSLRLTGAMTVAAWVKVNPGDAGRIISKGGGASSRGWEMAIEPTAANGTGGHAAFMIGRDSANLIIANSSPIPRGEWVHLAGVYEPGAAVKIYVNGRMEASNTENIPVTQYSNSLNVNIGRRASAANYFKGDIDDLLVYNYALPEACIEALAEAEQTLPPFLTVAYSAGEHGTMTGQGMEKVTEGGYPAYVPAVTADLGKIFTGWSSDGGTTVLSVDQVSATPVTQSITYVAHYWEVNPISVTLGVAHGADSGTYYPHTWSGSSIIPDDDYSFKLIADDSDAVATGTWAAFPINVPAAGTYNIKLLMDTKNDRAMFQFSAGEKNEEDEIIYRDVGDAVDCYILSDTAVEEDFDAGGITFDTAGTKYFRYMITGRNPLAQGDDYNIRCKTITLTPLKTADMEFSLIQPEEDQQNIITVDQNASPKTVSVNVAGGTDTVVIGGVKTAAQTVTIEGADKNAVTAGGTDTAPTYIVDMSSGSIKSFSLSVHEAVYFGITYNVMVDSKGGISEIIQPDDIRVSVGISLVAIKNELPKKVTARYEDGSTVQLPVEWENISFNPNVEGTYNNIEGNVEGTNLKAYITIRVLPVGEISEVRISGAESIWIPLEAPPPLSSTDHTPDPQPMHGKLPVRYRAEVIDSNGDIISDEAVEWSLNDENYPGISIDHQGILMVSPDASPGEIIIRARAASAGEIYEDKTVVLEQADEQVMLLSRGAHASATASPPTQFSAGRALIPGLSDVWMADGTNNNYPLWWRVNLGDVYELQQFETVWRTRQGWYRYSYRVEVSLDDVNYETVIDHTDVSINWNLREQFDKVEAQYVRIYFTGGQTTWTSAAELKVYGTGKILSIKPVDDIIINAGTPVDEIPLPAQVEAVYTDGSSAGRNVTWDTTGLSTGEEGTYLLEGAVEGVSGLKASARVIVQAPLGVASVSVSGAESVRVPEEGSVVLQYAAVVMDQYNQTMDSETVTWKLAEAVPGVGIDSTGLLTVTNAAEVGTVTVEASSVSNPSVSGTKTVLILGEGTTLYVSPQGSDSNAGTTIDAPLRTIQKAVDAAHAGDTVYIRGGVYHEAVIVRNSGTAENKIVISGYQDEEAIIDGKIDGQLALPAGTLLAPDYAKYKYLLSVAGDHVEVYNLSVRNSRGSGAGTRYNPPTGGMLIGNYVRFSGLKVSYCFNAGISLERSSYSIVENCELWECSNIIAPYTDDRADGIWPPALATGKSNHCILRGNIVRNSYGEGIDDLLSNNTIIEDNIVYDVLKVGIYADNSKDAIIRRNIVYWTDDTAFWRYGTRPGPGICLSDETYSSMNPTAAVQVYNNFVYNAGDSFAIWRQNQNITFNNSVVAYNTFVNTLTGSAGDASMGVQVHNGIPAVNSVFMNNIIKQDNGSITNGAPETGFVFSNNLWSRPVSGRFSGEGDIIGDPLLQLGAGIPDATWMKLESLSPAINKAQLLEGVAEDLFGTERGSSPDIGAYEYVEADVADGLSGLALSSGNLEFAPGTFAYSVNVDANVEAVTITPEYEGGSVTVNGGEVESGAESGAIHLLPGQNIITVVYEDEAGESSTYTITVVRAPEETSAAISLAEAGFDLTSPQDISTEITDWGSATTVTGVVYGTDPLNSADEYILDGDTLTIKADYLTGLNLTEGQTAVFEISFDAGEKATLTVNVLESQTPDADASLSGLTVGGVAIAGFAVEVYHYTIELPYGTLPGSVAATVAATPAGPGASMVITQAASLPGTATVKVTAEDGMTEQIYTITINIAIPYVISNASISKDSGISAQATVTPKDGFAGGTAVVVFKLMSGNTVIGLYSGKQNISGAATFTAKFHGYLGAQYKVKVYVWDKLDSSSDTIGVNLAAPCEIP